MNLGDIGAWFSNVATSVVIIFVNKLLMGDQGYQFKFAVTLSGLHYLAAAFLMQGYKVTGLMQPKGTMSWRARLLYTAVSSVSIISLNVSLLLNQVGFYQIAKLCVIPFVAAVEYVAYGHRFSGPVIACMVTVIVGVAIVTVTNVAVSAVGFCVALLSIVAAGSQQLLCRHQQKTLNITANEMLLYTALPMSTFLLVVGPGLDQVIKGDWVFDYNYNYPSIAVLVTSCALAVGVNLSQFMCLGRFTAVAYQILGHTKTICVLLGGAMLFHEPITPKIALGMFLAVVGIIGYGYLTHKEKQAREAAAQEQPPGEEKVLLGERSGSGTAAQAMERLVASSR